MSESEPSLSESLQSDCDSSDASSYISTSLSPSIISAAHGEWVLFSLTVFVAATDTGTVCRTTSLLSLLSSLVGDVDIPAELFRVLFILQSQVRERPDPLLLLPLLSSKPSLGVSRSTSAMQELQTIVLHFFFGSKE